MEVYGRKDNLHNVRRAHLDPNRYSMSERDSVVSHNFLIYVIIAVCGYAGENMGLPSSST